VNFRSPIRDFERKDKFEIFLDPQRSEVKYFDSKDLSEEK